jgi:DNA polymerase I-like protein with 3'-5' exonuclease and polymerase domains
MNLMDQEVCQEAAFSDCRLVLTMHDSLIYKVPQAKADAFVGVARPILSCRPYWADIDMKVKVEVGRRFGEMETV